MTMDSNLPFFSLPFVDSGSSDIFNKNKSQECSLEELHSTLPSTGSLLAADDVLVQILTADGPLEEPDLNGPTTLHCEICKKQFDNTKKYYGHLRVHSKDNPWTCEKCPNQKFSTKQQLMKHSLTHKPLEKVWRCPQCTMAFEALWRLQQHLFAKHLDYSHYRTHKCDECEKSFHKKSDLLKHKDFHSDVKKHACTLCDVKFKDKSNLKRHMLKHNNEKPFCCPGCKNRFKQIASLRRHTSNCVLLSKRDPNIDRTTRKYYCKVCGFTSLFKNALSDHIVSQHTDKPKETEKEIKSKTENNTNVAAVDTNRTVDNIVDDILSAEDDYMTMTTHNEMLNVYNHNVSDNTNNLMQLEFLKDMSHLHALDDELFYNDIDFDAFQTSQIFNSNEEFHNERNTEILFDFNDPGRSLDQDMMNALLIKAEHLPDELLNVTQPEVEKTTELVPNQAVAVNDCATIFESDVDLEASTTLAANLNQLIGENSLNTVQYISTEDDDTFIISLNSEIDAEQLTDMLNMGVELDNNIKAEKHDERDTSEDYAADEALESEPVVVQIEEPKENLVNSVNENSLLKKLKRKQVLYICRRCNKVFNKKDNYKSHFATHEPSLRRHKCEKCGERFSYKSSLNKHRAAKHEPRREPAIACHLCDKRYRERWMLKQHIERDHEKLLPYVCDNKDCDSKFYKKSDLVLHKKYHTGDRPHKCDICYRRFPTRSQLKRHVRTVDCTKHARKKI